MINLKSFFKHKFVIVALCFVLIGAAALVIMSIIPKAKTYTSSVNRDNFGEIVEYKIKFIDDDILKTYYVTKDGSIGNEKEFSYFIKNKTLYIEGDRLGKIDIYGIYAYSAKNNSSEMNISYQFKPAIFAKYASFGLMSIGGVMLIIAICVGISKKKKV